MENKFREEKIKIAKNVFMTLILFGMFSFLYFLIIIMISDIYSRYRYYIIKVWLLPSLIQLIFVKFLINYLMHFIKSYLLFNYFAMRKVKPVIKFLYMIFLPKHYIHMYRIRNFITKYYTKLSNKLE